MEDPQGYDFDLEYEKLVEKYKLPAFEELAQDFDIEKVAEKETAFILREVRRSIAEKFSAYMHLLENLLNPSAPPMFVYTILKSVGEGDKEVMRDIYKKFSKLQVRVMKLDTIYNEETEAKFIIDSNKTWQGLKKKIFNLVSGFEDNWEKGISSKNSHYLG